MKTLHQVRFLNYTIVAGSFSECVDDIVRAISETTDPNGLPVWTLSFPRYRHVSFNLLTVMKSAWQLFDDGIGYHNEKWGFHLLKDFWEAVERLGE